MRIPIETFRLPNGLFVTLVRRSHGADRRGESVVPRRLGERARPAAPDSRTCSSTCCSRARRTSRRTNTSSSCSAPAARSTDRPGSSARTISRRVPSNQLELALWLEANRMGKLLPAMTQQKLDTQRDVVMNERRWSMDNQPYGTWMEKLPALCFPPEHPFHHSLIGSMEDLTAASLDDVAQFFATYYTPDNAVLSIAGDFEPADARRLVETHFGGIPRGGGKPPLPDMSLPPVFGEWKREVVPDDIMLPRLFLAFRSPAFGTTRVLRGERVRRGARPAKREPAAPAPRARATGCGRGDGVHVRSREGSDLLVVDVDGAAGRLGRAARAGSRERDRRRRARRRDPTRKSSARSRSFRRCSCPRCSRPASAPIDSRCSRRIFGDPTSW